METSARADLFARLVCLLIAAVFACGSAFGFSLPRPGVLPWVLGIAAAINLVAGTFGPRSPRVWIASWLPWF